jgi:hypothetical protein
MGKSHKKFIYKNMESNQKTNEIFTTRDITLATTLVTLKFFMNGVDYQLESGKPSPICYFKFINGPDLQDAIKKYMQSLIAVEPKIFMTNLRALKSEVDNFHSNPYFNPALKDKLT